MDINVRNKKNDRVAVWLENYQQWGAIIFQ